MTPILEDSRKGYFTMPNKSYIIVDTSCSEVLPVTHEVALCVYFFCHDVCGGGVSG